MNIKNFRTQDELDIIQMVHQAAKVGRLVGAARSVKISGATSHDIESVGIADRALGKFRNETGIDITPNDWDRVLCTAKRLKDHV